MQVKLIYNTPSYHKLVEAVARNCYQSYDKVGDDSHRFIKSIMKKGHLSIASVGNIVFKLSDFESLEDYHVCIRELMVYKEINNMIRWTGIGQMEDSHGHIIVSMNLLTLIDISKGLDSFCSFDSSTGLFRMMMEEVNRVTCLAWFFNEEDICGSENVYLRKRASVDDPVIMTEDYTSLKALGLTGYELDIHSTVTVNFVTDRSIGLQLWRHSDMAGGTELSQRYVNRENAEYRLPCVEGQKDVNTALDVHMKYSITTYNAIYEGLVAEGMNHGRAKEIARAVLPNALQTEIIQCRPLRQWKYLFSLRLTPHAQKECRSDVSAIAEGFKSFLSEDIFLVKKDG